jgi:hypothetical protein
VQPNEYGRSDNVAKSVHPSILDVNGDV